MSTKFGDWIQNGAYIGFYVNISERSSYRCLGPRSCVVHRVLVGYGHSPCHRLWTAWYPCWCVYVRYIEEIHTLMMISQDRPLPDFSRGCMAHSHQPAAYSRC
jgi:hypothetical protein